MAENIFKLFYRQGINFQNKKMGHTTQYKKNPNNPIKNGQKI